MKPGRLLVLLALVIGLLAGPWQAPAEAEMLGRIGQIKSLYYSGGNWYQTKPDGSTSAFALASGQAFVMTGIYLRFYVSDTTTQTGPYRFYLLGPNETPLYIMGLTNATYPGSDTVWGGTLTDTSMGPGIVFTSLPTPQVRQMPQPPASPNSGTVYTGTFYMTVRGYVVP